MSSIDNKDSELTMHLLQEKDTSSIISSQNGALSLTGISDEDIPISQVNDSDVVQNNNNEHGGGHLGYFEAFMLMTSFQTSGSIILIPWSYGRLGFVVGPLVHLVVVGIVLFFNCFMVDVVLGSKNMIKTLAGVGYELGGGAGQRLFLFLQMLNLILYIPVALETIALSLQYLSGNLWNCSGYWYLITFGILLCLQQAVTEWKEAAWFARLTAAIAAARGFLLLPYAFATYREEVTSSDAYLGPALAAGSPENNWHDIALAVSAFSYTFAPSFILVEVMNDMRDKQSYKSALVTSSAFQVSIYVVAGLTGVLLWGWNLDDPISLQIPNGWVGLLLSAMVAIATCLDYIISSKIVIDWVRVTFLPRLHYIWLRILSLTIALGVILAIPNLSTSVGVIAGFSNIGSNTWAVSLAWIWGGKKIQKSTFHTWFIIIAGGVCMPYAVWVIAAAVYQIIIADNSSGHFFCQGN